MSLRDTEVQKFNNRLSLLQAHHDELKLAIHNKRNEASLESELVTQFILSVSVLWQSFVHDLFIAYTLMDDSRAMASIKERVTQSIKNKFGTAVAKKCHFETPANLSQAKIIDLLDPKGWNISVSTSRQLSKKANELLVSRHAIKFSLDSENSEFFDYLVSLRNFLSHNSKGARKNFIESMKALNEDINQPLKKLKFNQIGPYLKGAVNNDTTRASLIVSRLQGLSNSL